MAEREKMTEAVWFRIEPSRRTAWDEAIGLLGWRGADFYRTAIDSLADEVLAAHNRAEARLPLRTVQLAAKRGQAVS